MNRNAVITSVVARYLSSPTFRQEISHKREHALLACGLDLSCRQEFLQFDFSGLESFGGLIAKTQHNFLYEFLPYTRHLMRLYGLDLRIFSAYRDHIQSAPLSELSRAEKVRRFANYLQSFLARKDASFPGLADLLQHEYILWDLKTSPPAGTRVSTQIRRSTATLRNAVPLLRPGVRLAKLRYHPLHIIDSLERGRHIRINQRRRTHLVYWTDALQSQIRIAEPGPTIWKVMRLCDGKHRVAVLCRKLANLRPATVRQSIAFAEESGLIFLESTQ